MKLKITLENVMFSFILYFQMIFMLSSVILPDMTNRIVLLFLFVLYFYFNKYVAVKSLSLFFISNFVLIFYTFYNIYNYHLAAVLHSDFYSFVLLMLVLLTYSNKDVVDRFTDFFYQHKKHFLYSVLIFFLLLLYSVLFQNGLHTGFGSRIPVLYGPYAVPHILAYGLLALYCASAILYGKYQDKIFLFLKVICVCCIIWTAARSAVLAIAILILGDFLSIQKISRKVIVASVVILGLLYIVFFTDLLINNPLIQKTLSALEQGSITNGRNRFAEIVLNYYNDSTSVWEKVFGTGMSSLRNILQANASVGVGIHAHNDYINSLCGYGLVGLVVFVICQLKPIKLYKKLIYIFLLEAFLFILSFYNGLAMYTVLTPCLIMIFIFFMKSESKKVSGDLKQREGGLT